jgi:hypothetical protein
MPDYHVARFAGSNAVDNVSWRVIHGNANNIGLPKSAVTNGAFFTNNTFEYWSSACLWSSVLLSIAARVSAIRRRWRW